MKALQGNGTCHQRVKSRGESVDTLAKNRHACPVSVDCVVEISMTQATCMISYMSHLAGYCQVTLVTEAPIVNNCATGEVTGH